MSRFEDAGSTNNPFRDRDAVFYPIAWMKHDPVSGGKAGENFRLSTALGSQ
jgi:hypothetical protein